MERLLELFVSLRTKATRESPTCNEMEGIAIHKKIVYLGKSKIMKKYTLVIGASENVQRYSNMAIRRLLDYNHLVKAIGNKVGEVRGVKIEKGLIPYEDIDTITLYLNPTNQIPYYDYILNLNPKRVIFNPGTENKELQEKLKESGISYEEACTLVLLGTNQY